MKERIEKYSIFAKEVFGIKGAVNEKTAKAGIDSLVNWFKKIVVPTNFKEANIPTSELDAMADDILITAEHWGIKTYNKEMVLSILKLCL